MENGGNGLLVRDHAVQPSVSSKETARKKQPLLLTCVSVSLHHHLHECVCGLLRARIFSLTGACVDNNIYSLLNTTNSNSLHTCAQLGSILVEKVRGCSSVPAQTQ